MESFNKHIHPLSIFRRHPPDIERLSEKYKFLKKHLINNRANLSDYDTCSALCRAILLEYFEIIYWKLPKGHLVPSIVQRMNYLCWIKEITEKSELKVLDIGTGANVIFPLIGSRAFGWEFIATERDKNSYTTALKIVKKNDLSEKITIHLVKSGILSEVTADFDVSICNPPFFESGNIRTDRFGGLPYELSTPGGELTFIKQYITESWRKRRTCSLFSCLIGVKSHLPLLKSFLELNFPSSSTKDSTLYQGHTLRWVLAWHFK